MSMQSSTSKQTMHRIEIPPVPIIRIVCHDGTLEVIVKITVSFLVEARERWSENHLDDPIPEEINAEGITSECMKSAIVALTMGCVTVKQQDVGMFISAFFALGLRVQFSFDKLENGMMELSLSAQPPLPQHQCSSSDTDLGGEEGHGETGQLHEVEKPSGGSSSQTSNSAGFAPSGLEILEIDLASDDEQEAEETDATEMEVVIVAEVNGELAAATRQFEKEEFLAQLDLFSGSWKRIMCEICGSGFPTITKYHDHKLVHSFLTEIQPGPSQSASTSQMEIEKEKVMQEMTPTVAVEFSVNGGAVIVKAKRTRKTFSAEEDAKIIEGIREYGEDWRRIAATLTNRGRKVVFDRYWNVLKRREETQTSGDTDSAGQKNGKDKRGALKTSRKTVVPTTSRKKSQRKQSTIKEPSCCISPDKKPLRQAEKDPGKTFKSIFIDISNKRRAFKTSKKIKEEVPPQEKDCKEASRSTRKKKAKTSETGTTRQQGDVMRRTRPKKNNPSSSEK